MKTLFPALVLVVGLALPACDDGDRPDGPSSVGTTVVRSTTSFGFCLGYCRSALEITAERATYRLFDDRTGQPALERIVPLTAAEWQSLDAAVSRESFEALPAVVGCPDCADGGAESLEVVAEGWSRTVTFEYGDAVPQLQPLLDRTRAIRQRLDRDLRPPD